MFNTIKIIYNYFKWNYSERKNVFFGRCIVILNFEKREQVLKITIRVRVRSIEFIHSYR